MMEVLGTRGREKESRGEEGVWCLFFGCSRPPEILSHEDVRHVLCRQ